MPKRRRASVDIIYEDDVNEQQQEFEDDSATTEGSTIEIASDDVVEEVEEIEATIEEPIPIESEGAQIFQSYEEVSSSEQPIDAEIEAQDIESEAVEQTQEINLLDYFPNTPEEYEKGFRRLSQKEKKAWGVPTEEEYDTIPGLAHSLGVARNTVESWIFQCLDRYPSGFLKTRMGLTAECFVALQIYRNYCGGENYTKARKSRFLKKLDEQHEQYLLHMAHREDEQEKTKQESAQHSSALTYSPTVVEGEFVDEQTQLQIQVAAERSDRKRDAGIEDYVLRQAIQSISGTYIRVSQLKPLMDQAIQNGLTGKDLPDLSKIYTKE